MQCQKCNKTIRENSTGLCRTCFNHTKRVIKQQSFCVDCGTPLKTKAKRCYSCNMKQRIASKGGYFGELNPRYKDGKYSDDKTCSCGKPMARLAKRCSECFHKEHSEMLTGKNNPNYIHGQGNYPYPLEFSNNLKEAIKQRDNYTCQNCNITEEEHLIVFGEVLSVHHIDYNKFNNEPFNLITTCRNCNTRANFNREYWQTMFRGKLCYHG